MYVCLFVFLVLHLFLALMLPEALTIFLAKQQSEKKAVNDDDEKLHVSVPSRVKEIFEANDLFGQPNDILPTRGSDPADLYFLIMQTTSSAGLTPLHLSAALGNIDVCPSSSITGARLFSSPSSRTNV